MTLGIQINLGELHFDKPLMLLLTDLITSTMTLFCTSGQDSSDNLKCINSKFIFISYKKAPTLPSGLSVHSAALWLHQAWQSVRLISLTE